MELEHELALEYAAVLEREPGHGHELELEYEAVPEPEHGRSVGLAALRVFSVVGFLK